MDTKTPTGFLIAAFIEFLSMLSSGELFTIVFILTLGYCWFLNDLVFDLELCIKRLNINEETITFQKRIKIKQQLCAILGFHSKARALVESVSIFLWDYFNSEFIFVQAHNTFLKDASWRCFRVFRVCYAGFRLLVPGNQYCNSINVVHFISSFKFLLLTQYSNPFLMI